MDSFQLLLLFLLLACLENSYQSVNYGAFLQYRDAIKIDALNNDNTFAKLFVPSMELALTNCRKQFQWDPWNCPTSDFLSKRSLQYYDREVAFMKAISVASIVYTLARNCSRGQIAECSCQSTTRIGLSETVHDCSDNVAYGEKFVRRMLNDPAKRTFDAQGYAEMHNSRAAKMAVGRALRHRCRCIDPLEGCQQQICSRLLKPFNEIAQDIRQMYNRALLLTTDNSGAINTDDVSPSVLVYTRVSPNYCQVNAIPDWPGLRGRLCSRTNDRNRTLAERRSCRNLCRTCGHPVRTEMVQTRTRCNCQFRWCCEIKCEICETFTKQHFCG